ncbi:MAG TPA: hypothetical protein VFT29_19070 [Gemmatimonadaceae bacterium]|nr:hypothetical protein [Gemmatimonadaceae bacterium]
MNAQSVRSSAVLVALAISAAILPSSLTAQDSTAVVVLVAPTPAVATAVPIVKLTPSSAGWPGIVPAGITNPRAADVQLLPLGQDGSGNGSNIAMMVVGGAGIVVGSVVGGDGGYIIAISGAVIGLIGLFRYVR